MSYDAPVPHTGHAPTSTAATNTKAVVALPLAFSFSLLGLVFGILALREIGRTGEGGRGFAITAVVLGALNLLFVVLFLGLFAAGIASGIQQMQQLQGVSGF
ncbi:DUF4190 domain-containing protein [Pseudokineococcus basanitobsidens]|uniref:DUF4190 domain-containing protein n=1 Tax=Pseudokineococcus basanitobsidens TaxID=1926649 RepID=A0ABU8RGG2_9ACTN